MFHIIKAEGITSRWDPYLYSGGRGGGSLSGSDSRWKMPSSHTKIMNDFSDIYSIINFKFPCVFVTFIGLFNTVIMKMVMTLLPGCLKMIAEFPSKFLFKCHSPVLWYCMSANPWPFVMCHCSFFNRQMSFYDSRERNGDDDSILFLLNCWKYTVTLLRKTNKGVLLNLSISRGNLRLNIKHGQGKHAFFI